MGPAAADPVIVTAALTKSYGDGAQRALDSLDLSIAAGEIFGFLGSNGAGKTTTIRCLLDLIHPTTGSASILGLDSQRDSSAEHARIGYLPGDLRLYPRLTGMQLCMYLGRLRGGVEPAAVTALAARLDVRLDQRCGALSHGQRQKVGLIQALMHEPDVLILDEPTATLDPLAQGIVHELVHEAKQRGATVFLSSHDLTEVARICDRVGILRKGRLVAVKDVAALEQEGRQMLTIDFSAPVDAAAFATLDGVAGATASGTTLTVDVAGDIDAVIKLAATQHVRSIRSTEVELDDIFRGYYTDGPTEPESTT